MNCEKIKEKLSLYIDDLLELEETEAIRLHLKGCDSCKAYYDKLVKLGQMVDDFVTTDNEAHWEDQKNKVLEKIEQAETGQIIDVIKSKRRGRFYKYMAVAASLALVAFVSIYESQEFDQLKGLFDNSKETTTDKFLESGTSDEIEIRGGRADEMTIDVDSAELGAEKVEEIIQVDEDVVDEESEPVAELQKIRTERSSAKFQSAREKLETNIVSDDTEMEKPATPEPTLELGEPLEPSDYSEMEPVPRPAGMPAEFGKAEPMSLKPQPLQDKIDKMAKRQEAEMSSEERKRSMAENFNIGRNDLDNIMSPELDGMEFSSSPNQAGDSIKSKEYNYQIRLDSLEAQNPGIYSPHFIESMSKSKKGILPDSLDKIVLEIAETCFQVGILTENESKREEMINKLRRLSDNGSPEAIERIQRYIVMLMSAD